MYPVALVLCKKERNDTLHRVRGMKIKAYSRSREKETTSFTIRGEGKDSAFPALTEAIFSIREDPLTCSVKNQDLSKEGWGM